MSFEGQEAFFGTGRTAANARRSLGLGLLITLAMGLLFITMWWWGAPDENTGDVNAVYQFGFLISPLIGVFFLYRFARGLRLLRQAMQASDGEVLWYVLDADGLHIRHDLDRFAPVQIRQGEAGSEHLVPWDAMKSLSVAAGPPPVATILRRLPGAVIDRTLTLATGQRARDGSVFEDRLAHWFALTRAPAPAPQMTGALPPDPAALRDPG